VLFFYGTPVYTLPFKLLNVYILHVYFKTSGYDLPLENNFLDIQIIELNFKTNEIVAGLRYPVFSLLKYSFRFMGMLRRVR
jgi:hypothetical protein